jgi:zinc finger SWIM domain-containing protein 3
VIPRVAMEFEIKDHACKCYNRYAVLKGFIISEKVVKSPHYKLNLIIIKNDDRRQGKRYLEITKKMTEPLDFTSSESHGSVFKFIT